MIKTIYSQILSQKIDFSCPICSLGYDDKQRAPMMMCRAQHTCCLDCLDNKLFHQQIQNQEVKCIFCRVPILRAQAQKFRLLDEIRQTAENLKIYGKKIKQKVNSDVETLMKELQKQKQKNQWLIQQQVALKESLEEIIISKINNKQKERDDELAKVFEVLKDESRNCMILLSEQSKQIKEENKQNRYQIAKLGFENRKLNQFVNEQMLLLKNQNQMLMKAFDSSQIKFNKENQYIKNNTNKILNQLNLIKSGSLALANPNYKSQKQGVIYKKESPSNQYQRAENKNQSKKKQSEKYLNQDAKIKEQKNNLMDVYKIQYKNEKQIAKSKGTQNQKELISQINQFIPNITKHKSAGNSRENSQGKEELQKRPDFKKNKNKKQIPIFQLQNKRNSAGLHNKYINKPRFQEHLRKIERSNTERLLTNQLDQPRRIKNKVLKTDYQEKPTNKNNIDDYISTQAYNEKQKQFVKRMMEIFGIQQAKQYEFFFSNNQLLSSKTNSTELLLNKWMNNILL